MRTDWLPTSAAALAVGGSALFLGARTTPRPNGDGAVLHAFAQEADPWVSPAIILLVAAVGLLIGLPSLLMLLGRHGRLAGRIAVVLMAVAAVTLAGLAQQLLFLQSLTQRAGVDPAVLVDAFQDGAQWRLVVIGFVCFYVGELCLAYALWRGRRTPRFVPVLFVAHVVLAGVTLPLESSRWESVPALLVAAAFASCAICANLAGQPTRRSSADVAAMHAEQLR